jgi:hypothetical protein
VEGALEHDDLRSFDAALVRVQPRQLDRRLVGLGAGVAEEHPLHARGCGQPRAQRLLPLDAVDIGAVQQATGLRLMARRDPRVAWPRLVTAMPDTPSR